MWLEQSERGRGQGSSVRALWAAGGGRDLGFCLVGNWESWRAVVRCLATRPLWRPLQGGQDGKAWQLGTKAGGWVFCPGGP